MFLIGLTGGIATGKSLVSSMIQKCGVPVIDADKIAYEITLPGQAAYEKIKITFGDEIMTECGNINREKLGAIIFSNKEKRKQLNRITHPVIAKEMKKRIGQHLLKGDQFVVLDVPLLFETRTMLKYIYKTIVVSCDEESQLQRLMIRNKHSERDAKQIINCQLPLETKIEQADFIIENSSTIANTRQQVENIMKLLKASRRHIRNRFLYGVPFIGVILAFIWIFKLMIFYHN